MRTRSHENSLFYTDVFTVFETTGFAPVSIASGFAVKHISGPSNQTAFYSGDARNAGHPWSVNLTLTNKFEMQIVMKFHTTEKRTE